MGRGQADERKEFAPVALQQRKRCSTDQAAKTESHEA